MVPNVHESHSPSNSYSVYFKSHTHTLTHTHTHALAKRTLRLLRIMQLYASENVSDKQRSLQEQHSVCPPHDSQYPGNTAAQARKLEHQTTYTADIELEWNVCRLYQLLPVALHTLPPSHPHTLTSPVHNTHSSYAQPRTPSHPHTLTSPVHNTHSSYAQPLTPHTLTPSHQPLTPPTLTPSPFPPVALGEDGDHSLDWAEYGTVNDDRSPSLLTVRTSAVSEWVRVWGCEGVSVWVRVCVCAGTLETPHRPFLCDYLPNKLEWHQNMPQYTKTTQPNKAGQTLGLLQ